MVDPSDGTLTGIIDSEFANILPLQAGEHYPGFLADQDRFLKRFGDDSDTTSRRFAKWGEHYARLFQDDLAEVEEFNGRIEAIILFEYLLRHFKDCLKEEIEEAFRALKESGALQGPLPRLPWDDEDTLSGSTSPVEQSSLSTDVSSEQDEVSGLKATYAD